LTGVSQHNALGKVTPHTLSEHNFAAGSVTQVETAGFCSGYDQRAVVIGRDQIEDACWQRASTQVTSGGERWR
jgi:hypothetical protein